MHFHRKGKIERTHRGREVDRWRRKTRKRAHKAKEEVTNQTRRKGKTKMYETCFWRWRRIIANFWRCNQTRLIWWWWRTAFNTSNFSSTWPILPLHSSTEVREDEIPLLENHSSPEEETDSIEIPSNFTFVQTSRSRQHFQQQQQQEQFHPSQCIPDGVAPLIQSTSPLPHPSHPLPSPKEGMVQEKQFEPEPPLDEALPTSTPLIKLFYFA